MSKKKSRAKRFVPLVKLAENKEQAAAIALGTCNQKVQQSKDQLEQLKLYRSEYVQQLNKDGNQGMDASMLKAYKDFIAGLDTAIKQQNIQLQESQLQYAQQKQDWLHEHQRKRVMEVTVKKYSAQEARDQDRREQNALDEFATMSTTRPTKPK